MDKIKAAYKEAVLAIGGGGDATEAGANFQKAVETVEAEQQAVVSDFDVKIKSLEDKLVEANAANESLVAQVAAKDGEIEKVNASLKEVNDTIEVKDTRISELSTENGTLVAANKELSKVAEPTLVEVTSTVEDDEITGNDLTGDPAVDGMRQWEKLLKKSKNPSQN